MATTNNGTNVTAPDEQVPTNYTRPTATEFTDYKYTRRAVLSVLKATVENATPNTTMGNIITNASIGITKQVTDIVTADFATAINPTCFARIIKIENLDPPQSSGNFFKNTAASYLVTVDIFVK